MTDQLGDAAVRAMRALGAAGTLRLPVTACLPPLSAEVVGIAGPAGAEGLDYFNRGHHARGPGTAT